RNGPRQDARVPILVARPVRAAAPVIRYHAGHEFLRSGVRNPRLSGRWHDRAPRLRRWDVRDGDRPAEAVVHCGEQVGRRAVHEVDVHRAPDAVPDVGFPVAVEISEPHEVRTGPDVRNGPDALDEALPRGAVYVDVAPARRRDVRSPVAVEVDRPRVVRRSPIIGNGPYLLCEAPPGGEVHVDVAADGGRDVRLAVAVEVPGPDVPGIGPVSGDGPHLLQEAR